MMNLGVNFSWRKTFRCILLGVVLCPLTVLLLRRALVSIAPHYPALFGQDLIALLMITIYSVAITFVLYFGAIWFATKSWSTALLCVAGVFVANQIIAGLIPSRWTEFDPNLPKMIEGKQTEILKSVELTDVSQSLACKIRDNIWKEREAYRDLVINLALELKQQGHYRFSMKLAQQAQSAKSAPSSAQIQELDLPAGKHALSFKFDFGTSWGYFVPRGELRADLSVDKLVAPADLVDPNTLPLEFRRLEGKSLTTTSFRRLITQELTIQEVSHVLTDMAPAHINCE